MVFLQAKIESHWIPKSFQVINGETYNSLKPTIATFGSNSTAPLDHPKANIAPSYKLIPPHDEIIERIPQQLLSIPETNTGIMGFLRVSLVIYGIYLGFMGWN